MKQILIDSDVILDFFFDREPYSTSASKVLSLCEGGMIKGFVTPVIISNVYYLLRQQASHAQVIEKLKVLLSFLEPISMTKEAVMLALYSDFSDFEDALQNYAAQIHQDIGVIVTRNTKDYKKSQLAVLNTEQFLKSLSI